MKKRLPTVYDLGLELVACELELRERRGERNRLWNTGANEERIVFLRTRIKHLECRRVQLRRQLGMI